MCSLDISHLTSVTFVFALVAKVFCRGPTKFVQGVSAVFDQADVKLWKLVGQNPEEFVVTGDLGPRWKSSHLHWAMLRINIGFDKHGLLS